MEREKSDDLCSKNKDLTVDSSSSVSENSSTISLKSTGISRPSSTYPLKRRISCPVRRVKGGWTLEEDATLERAVATFGGKCWKKIAGFFPDRTKVQCMHRWQNVLNPKLVKGLWTQEEDEKLTGLIAKFGLRKWSFIANSLPGRIGKQCRERWHYHLNPNIKKEAWTLEEELTLLNAHRSYGSKWSELTKLLPGRTDNAIKNHWHGSLKKKWEFYLVTGSLPSFAKCSSLTGDTEIKKIAAIGELHAGSNKGSNSVVLASRETTDICESEDRIGRPEERSKDHSVASYRQTDSTNSENTKNEAMQSLSETLHPIKESEMEKQETCCEADQYHMHGASLRYEIPVHGTLFYEPQTFNSYGQLDSTLGNTSLMQYQLDTCPATPPTPLITPSIRGGNFSALSPAKSFPNTAYILRKRSLEMPPKEAVQSNGKHNDTKGSENTELQKNSLCADFNLDDEDGISNNDLNLHCPESAPCSSLPLLCDSSACIDLENSSNVNSPISGVDNGSLPEVMVEREDVEMSTGEDEEELTVGYFNGVKVIIKNGFFVGEFSKIDDLSIHWE